MAEIIKIQAKKKKIPCRKRVAAYARVSSASERQEHSLTAQISHYSRLIQSNPEWEYAGLYSDDGISGTSIVKRRGFQDMIVDADAGKIDIILTKSISRFARNTVDLLQSVRHLKDIGVEVRFEKENIRSLSADGELMLSILASFAQEEIYNESQNIKWAVMKKGERGEHWGCPPFGYDLNYKIVEDEATIVRKIFNDYLSGRTMEEIGREISSLTNGLHGSSFVHFALKNEAYTGNITIHKRYAYAVGKEKKNEGEVPMIHIADHHEAIVSEKVFEAVRKRREEIGMPQIGKHNTWLTSKFICGCCGHTFIKLKKDLLCGHKKTYGPESCSNGYLRLEVLEKIISSVMGMKKFDADRFAAEIDHVLVDTDGTLTFFYKDGEERQGHYDFFDGNPWSLNYHYRVYGYKWNDKKKRYEALENEIGAVKQVISMYLDGKGIGCIAAEMKRQGYKNKSGGFSNSTVTTILGQVGFYAGQRVLKNGETDGSEKIIRNDHEAIISEELADIIKTRRMQDVKNHGNSRKAR